AVVFLVIGEVERLQGSDHLEAFFDALRVEPAIEFVQPARKRVPIVFDRTVVIMHLCQLGEYEAPPRFCILGLKRTNLSKAFHRLLTFADLVVCSSELKMSFDERGS